MAFLHLQVIRTRNTQTQDLPLAGLMSGSCKSTQVHEEDYYDS